VTGLWTHKELEAAAHRVFVRVALDRGIDADGGAGGGAGRGLTYLAEDVRPDDAQRSGGAPCPGDARESVRDAVYGSHASLRPRLPSLGRVSEQLDRLLWEGECGRRGAGNHGGRQGQPAANSFWKHRKSKKS